MPNDFNIILATDGYKLTHYKQYPPGTETVYSYLESRGGELERLVFFGLQYYLKRYLEGEVVTSGKIVEAIYALDSYFPGVPACGAFNKAGWQHILNKHKGRLPIRIKALPEGSVVRTNEVMMTIENTDPECFWLTNYLETLLMQIWYPITIASRGRAMRETIDAFVAETCGGVRDGVIPDLEGAFMLHDFGYRGASSQETAAIGGAAHLVNFSGTDNLAARELAYDYYGCRAGSSVPAAEHSTITSWGREHEVDAYRNMLKQYPLGAVSVVSDSFNIWTACSEMWGKILRDEVLARDGTLVVRPDSGDPVTVVLEVLERLGAAFGVTTNEKGYKELNPKVRIIQGDGIDARSLTTILMMMSTGGWAANNIVFGSGGALLQKVDRDTQKFAMKCSHVTVNGEGRDVSKDPITDTGKRSKTGRFRVIVDPSGDLRTVGENDEIDKPDQLETVFENGEVLRHSTLEEIRFRKDQQCKI